MVGSPPANAEDTGSSPGPGGSHMPRSDWARAPQLLGLRSRAHEPQLLKPARLEPGLRSRRGRHNERPVHPNGEWPLLTATREGRAQQRRPNAAKNKK